jgi:hypothetical protein
MAFQRTKPAAIGIKAPFPGFIEPALATPIEKVPTGSTRSIALQDDLADGAGGAQPHRPT